ncbi:MAG TPA: ATP-binding protein [Kaistiaceae bacterium]|nr:ATP-binding protein [Kaistiaceae bacterium]
MPDHQLWRARKRESRLASLKAVLAAGAIPLASVAARAQDAALSPPIAEASRFIGRHQATILALDIGLVAFAVIAAVALIRVRNRANEVEARQRGEIADLRAAVDRTEAILDAEDRTVIVWSGSDAAPSVLGGRARTGSNVPAERAGLLAFGSWLHPDGAQVLDEAVTLLRNRGEAFRIDLATQGGALVEARGCTAGGRAILWIEDLDGDRLELASTSRRHATLQRDVEGIRKLLEALPMPVWLRDADGALAWVNAAYAKAVDAADPEAAVAAGTELLDTAGRENLARSHKGSADARFRQPLVVAGQRRIFDIIDVASDSGSAGIATDVSEVERAQAELKRTIDFHARTLDELASAVAIFGADKRLHFHNAAYRKLFGVDPAFLDGAPEEAVVLDKLRVNHKLPEQANYREWRASLQEAYRSVETVEDYWHLPDGQTLRVLASPHPQGGVIWIYENVTERLDLESRYKSLDRVQRESFDHLAEGVAVFGSDGKLRLFSPAFAGIWHLSAGDLDGNPHFGEITTLCRRLHDDGAVWDRLKAAVTGLADSREPIAGRMERADQSVVDFAAIPLPDGATMLTFLDVSASVAVARMLAEKNEALETAAHLKNAFVHHVSYELRSPLTNIIGFAQLLSDAKIGELNNKQREYTGYIMSSSKALLAIINDILDLATIDAGIMEIDVGTVDVAGTIDAAIEGIQDRLVESSIEIVTSVPDDIGTFEGDEKRIRQVLFNLLSNAVAFSDEGGKVEVNAWRQGRSVGFSVADHGCGMPSEFIDAAFERFESRSSTGRRRGAGLGLSIVRSFVELHGGRVEIRSAEGVGTTVICRFPLRPGETLEEAAE